MKQFLSAAVMALLLAACKPAITGDTIKIGYLGPLTGDAAGIGSDTRNGAEMAVEEINEAGGVGGKMLKLIVEDGRCNGADSAGAAQKLVNVDKVVAIVGGQCSSETLALAPIAEAGKVVVISPVSSSPDVTKAGEFTFRDYPSDALKGKAFAAFFRKAGYAKLAIISENTDFCQGIRDSVKKDLPSSVEVVFDELVDPGTKDYRTLMTRLKDLDFDVFLANGQSDATIVEMAKQMRELGMTQQIVGTDAADSANMGKQAKEAVEGLKPLSIPLLTEDDEHAGAFVEKFQDEYGEAKYTVFFAATAYDALKLLAKIIGEVGTDGTKIKDALYALDGYDGVIGRFSFDRNGDVVGVPFAMKEFKDGVLVQSELIPLN